MEEFFLHLWDEYDDLVGACRHVSSAAMGELLSAAPSLASAYAALVTLAAAILHLQRTPGT